MLSALGHKREVPQVSARLCLFAQDTIALTLGFGAKKAILWKNFPRTFNNFVYLRPPSWFPATKVENY